MAARYGRLISVSRFLPHICSGILHQASASRVSELSMIPLLQLSTMINGRIGERYFQIQRYYVPAEVINNSTSEVDILSSIQSAFDSNEGPNHCWINTIEGNIDIHKRNGATLLLVGQFLKDSSPTGHGSHVNLLTELKSIQHRCPELYIIGVQPDISGQLADYRNHLAQLMMKEYVSFPILLTCKDFFKTSGLPFYILFKDFENPPYFRGEELDHEIITKAVQDINNENKKVEAPKLFDFRWVSKQNEASKEPYLSSALQNLLLFSPGGLSADADGDRVFLSDSYHHRIIISDSNGKILDCIGSSPGFEDGAFESAKLFCPASTFYHAADNYLYIVDAENHAIRRADMERRIIETIYPRDYTNKKGNTIWTWIKNILKQQSNVVEASNTLDAQTVMFPWHMMQSTDNEVLIVDCSFERSWVLDLASGEIKEIIEGYSETMKVCQELIVEKLPLLEKVPHDWFQEQIPMNSPDEDFLYKRLISSVTTLGEHIFFCDTVGHRMLRINRNSGVSTNFELSNFGVLGLPYWLALPPESVYAIADGRWRAKIDRLQHFSLLPGRVNIHLSVDIPIDTELAEPLQESSIWRQARGSATEVLESEGVVGSTEKIGISQKFYDELDNLPYAESDEESIIEDYDNDNPCPTIEDEKVHIYCAVNASPGTSEVIIYAALYLKLRINLDIQDNHEHYAGRLADLLVPESSGEMGRDLCYQIFRKSGKNLKDFVFVKPLHVRLKLECSSHPKADNTKDIILTDTSLEVNVSL